MPLPVLKLNINQVVNIAKPNLNPEYSEIVGLTLRLRVQINGVS